MLKQTRVLYDRVGGTASGGAVKDVIKEAASDVSSAAGSPHVSGNVSDISASSVLPSITKQRASCTSRRSSSGRPRYPSVPTKVVPMKRRSTVVSGDSQPSLDPGRVVASSPPLSPPPPSSFSSSRALSPSGYVGQPESCLDSVHDGTLTTHSATIEWDTRPTASCTQRRFEDWELVTLRAEAVMDYLILKNRTEVGELERAETLAREEIVEDAQCQWFALCSRKQDTLGALGGGPLTGKGRAVQLLEERLQARTMCADLAARDEEEAQREEGRRAWNAHIEVQARRERDAAEQVRAAKEREDQFRGAVTFLIVRERRDREELEVDEHWARRRLKEEDVAGRAEADRLTYERFINSPEQQALIAAQRLQEERARKAAARRQRLHAVEQARFIEGCHHGRGGVSLFGGPAPKKVCGRCRVKFDDSLGYYVSMDAPPPSKAATKAPDNKKKEAKAVAPSSVSGVFPYAGATTQPSGEVAISTSVATTRPPPSPPRPPPPPEAVASAYSSPVYSLRQTPIPAGTPPLPPIAGADARVSAV